MTSGFRSAPLPPLVAGLLGLHQLRRCLYGLGGLPCFVLRHDTANDRIEWWPLLEDERRLRPFDFEFRLGKPEQRDVYHQENLTIVRNSGRARQAELHGYADLYVPLVIAPTATFVLYAGQFATEVQSYRTLERIWQGLSGHRAAAGDPLFQRWVRTCLEVPVLCPEQIRGLILLGRAISRLAQGDSLSSVQRRIEALRRRIFSPHAVDHDWVGSAVDHEGLTRPPWGLDPELEPRLVEELGLTRRPSLIALLTLDRRRIQSEPLESLVQMRALQHAAIRHCRRLESCLAAPLEDEAVILALSLDRRVRGKPRMRRFEALVRKLQGALAAQPGLPTVAGLGLEVVPGAGLGASYQQATMALASAIAERRTLGTVGPTLAGGVPARHELRLRSLGLAEAVARHATRELELTVKSFVRAVLAVEGRDPSGVRVWLMSSLDAVVSELEREGLLSAGQAREHRARAEVEFGMLSTSSALAEAFEYRMATWSELLARPQLADREDRLAAAIAWVERHLDTTSPLEAAAHRAGLAPSSFRRVFRQARGQSFGSWLRHTRVDAGALLLASEDLPVATLARRVGFGEVHAFIRSFRRRLGTTPAVYRRRLQAS